MIHSIQKQINLSKKKSPFSRTAQINSSHRHHYAGHEQTHTHTHTHTHIHTHTPTHRATHTHTHTSGHHSGPRGPSLTHTHPRGRRVESASHARDSRS